MTYQKKRKAKSWFSAVLLHIQKKKQPFSQFQQPDQAKTRCTITQTVAVPLHTLIEGKFVQGESVRFPIVESIDLFNPWENSIKMPSITWTGRCNSEAVAKSRNFWGHHKDGGYVYSDGPATYLEWKD